MAFRRILIAALASILASPAWGQGPSRQLQEEGRRLFQPESGIRAQGRSLQQWTIVLVVFSGPDKQRLAVQGLNKVRREAGLNQAFLQIRGEGVAVAYGRYDAPETAQAQADLSFIRELRVGGTQPFGGAVLAPPPVAQSAGNQQHDLRNVKRAFGQQDALYTLQIAAYGPADGRPTADEQRAAREAAETAVRQLRQQGELAYYYHGPNLSMVTVGVFGPDDHDPTAPGVESPSLRAARERYPNNLLNGKGVRERVPGVPETSPGAYRMQRSRLVAIPNQ